MTVPAHGADVELYGALKGQHFVQLNAIAPTLEEEAPAGFTAFADLASDTALTNATLRKPGGELLTLADADWFAGFDTLPELNAAYPNGAYEVTFYAVHDGLQQVGFSLTGDAYPNPPCLLNFGAAQHIDVASDFTFQWQPFAGGTANDFVQVEIEDAAEREVFSSPDPGAPGALNGLSNSFTLPRDILVTGRAYTAYVMFAKIIQVDTTSYPGSVGLAGYYKRTRIPLIAAGVDQATQPNLVFSRPQNGTRDVPRNSAIAFAFNQPMRPEYSLAWSSNIATADFTYTWSADQKTLYAVYAHPWPAGQTIVWTLNPPDGPQDFQDQAGRILPTQSGQFDVTTDTNWLPDLESAFVGKGREYVQTNAAPQSLERYVAGVYLELNSWNAVTNGSAREPTGRSGALLYEPDEMGLENEAAYAQVADREAFFPDGTYTLTLPTLHQGLLTFQVDLTNSLYPNAPTVLNLPQAQTVEPANSFTLSWSGFAGGTSDDLIFVSVENDQGITVWESDDLENDLDGTALAVTLPANTLAPGRTYAGEIEFVKIVDIDLTTSPGIVAGAAYAARTKFALQTTGQPIRPSLEVLPWAGDIFRVQVRGERGRLYTVEFTDQLGAASFWQPVWTEMATEQGFEYVDFSSPSAASRFYRVREGEMNEQP